MQVTVTDSAGVISRNSFPIRVVTIDPRFNFPNARIDTAFFGAMDVGGGYCPLHGRARFRSTATRSQLEFVGDDVDWYSNGGRLIRVEAQVHRRVGVTSFQERTIDVSGTTGAVSITTGYDLGVVGNGVPYSRTLTATGATTYVWTAQNILDLPPGVTLASNGVLSGTPTTNGTYSFLVKAANFDSPATNFAFQRFTLRVVPADDVFTFTTSTTLPFGNVGTAYSLQLEGDGGTDDLFGRLAYGSFMPPGLTFSMAGLIAGTPTSPGQFQFTVEVVQAGTGVVVAIRTFTLTIFSAGAGTPINVSPGVQDLGIRSIGSQQVNLNGSWGQWHLPLESPVRHATARYEGAANPVRRPVGSPGRRDDPGYVQLHSPYQQRRSHREPGDDSPNHVARRRHDGLPTAYVGVPYSHEMIANNGGAAPAWAITSGNVAGVTLSPSGLLSGTPTTATAAAGTNLTFSISNGVDTVTRTLALVVRQIQITTPRIASQHDAGSAL